MQPQLEDAAHAGADGLGVKHIHARADDGNILHIKAERCAENRADITAVRRVMQDDMRLVRAQVILELAEHRRREAVILPRNAGKRLVRLFHADMVLFRFLPKPLCALGSGASAMQQHAAAAFRAVQQAFHRREHPRCVGIIQLRRIG